MPDRKLTTGYRARPHPGPARPPSTRSAVTPPPRAVEAALILALRDRMAELSDRIDRLETARSETDAILDRERRAVSDALAELQGELDDLD